MNYRDIDLAEGQKAVFNVRVTAPADTDTTLSGGVTVQAADGSETDYIMGVDGEKLTAGTLPVGRHVYEIRSGGRTVVYGFLVVHPSPLAGETGGAQWQIVGDIGVADINIDIIDGMKGDAGDITPDLETLKKAAETAAVAAGESKTAASSSAASANAAARNAASSATFAESAATSASAASEAAQAAAAEITGQLSTKANADFDNVTDAAKQAAAVWASPDFSAGVAITNGYTVEYNGWLIVFGNNGTGSVFVNGKTVAIGNYYPEAWTGNTNCQILVRRGDIITWNYTYTAPNVKLYPIKGS